jgi:hypothetical protein
LRLAVLLGHADPCDLRVGVDNRGNGFVVDVTVARVDVLDSGDTCVYSPISELSSLLASLAETRNLELTFLLGLVSEHGTESDITDALDVLDRSVELRVDDDASLVVNLDANLVQVESLGDRSTANGHQDDVGLDL